MRATEGNRRMRTRRKLTGIVAASVLALSVIGGGTAIASVPGWTVGHGTDSWATFQPSSGASSTAVSAGKKVGFFEWLRNDGTSNISQLYLKETTSAAVFGAKWSIKDRDGNVLSFGDCPSTTPLACSFGALNPRETVYVIVAFTTPSNGKAEAVTFDWSSNGDTQSDKNHKSHGDVTSIGDSVVLTSTSDGDAAGDFNFDNPDGITVADDQKLTGKNPQATSATVGDLLTGVAVGDSPSLTVPCADGVPTGFLCSSLTSLVSQVEVGNGKTFSNPNGPLTPGIKVIVSFAQAPNQLNSDSPFAYHYYVDANGVGQVELITAPCTYTQGFPDNTASCLTVGNKQVTVWLTHNGGMRY